MERMLRGAGADVGWRAAVAAAAAALTFGSDSSPQRSCSRDRDSLLRGGNECGVSHVSQSQTSQPEARSSFR